MPKRIALGLILLLCAALPLAPAPQRAMAHPQAFKQHLQSQVKGYLSGQDGTFGVAALNLDDGRGLFLNADTVFPAASLYKVLVMYRVFQAIDQGGLSMDDTITIQDSDMVESQNEGWYSGDEVTVSEALTAMTTVSNNVAAYALTRQIGGLGAVVSAAEELGLSNTTMDSDGFWTTPQDMAIFFWLLADHQLVSPSASQQMIDLLKQQTVNDRLPALLPSGVEVAHKTGELDDVRNDGGIIYGTGGRYVLVVMSQGGAPDDETSAEAAVSQMVYQRYGG